MNKLPTQAFVFSGGFGMRMRPLTLTTHKSLIEIAGKPLLDHTLDHLQAAGVTDIYVNTHYKSEEVTAHLQARQQKQAIPRFHISYEPELLETGGTVALALPQLKDQPFFTLNPDTMLLNGNQPALERLSHAFDPDTMLAMLLLQPKDKAISYAGNGDFNLNNSNIIFPEDKSQPKDYVYTGVGIYSPKLFEAIPLPEVPFSLNHFFKALRDEDEVISGIHGLVHDGDWLHIGTPEELEEAKDFLT